MQAILANLFTAIKTRVADQLADIRYVEQDLGQLRHDKPPVSWPCLLIDLEQVSYTAVSENVQLGEGTVVLRLGLAPRSSGSQLTPLWATEKALQYYEMEWALNKLLHGWNPLPETGKLCRVSANTQQRNDGIRVRELKYTIAIEDFSTRHQKTTAHPRIRITEDI